MRWFVPRNPKRLVGQTKCAGSSINRHAALTTSNRDLLNISSLGAISQGKPPSFTTLMRAYGVACDAVYNKCMMQEAIPSNAGPSPCCAQYWRPVWDIEARVERLRRPSYRQWPPDLSQDPRAGRRRQPYTMVQCRRAVGITHQTP